VNRIGGGLLVLAFAGCATVVPVPDEAQVMRAQKLDPASDLTKLQTGRTRFIAKCAGCHSLPEPTDVKPDEWPDELDTMAVKARLKPEERQLIEVYLRTAQLPKD
jgi:hypothetical protein